MKHFANFLQLVTATLAAEAAFGCYQAEYHLLEADDRVFDVMQRLKDSFSYQEIKALDRYIWTPLWGDLEASKAAHAVTRKKGNRVWAPWIDRDLKCNPVV